MGRTGDDRSPGQGGEAPGSPAQFRMVLRLVRDLTESGAVHALHVLKVRTPSTGGFAGAEILVR